MSQRVSGASIKSSPSPKLSQIEPVPTEDQPSEFERTTQKIAEHQRVISTIKSQIQTIQSNKPYSGVDIEKLQCLKKCLNNEMQTLECIIQNAIEKQSEDPSKPWGTLLMPTTLEEDAVPHLMFYPSDIVKPTPSMKTKRKTSPKVEETDANSVKSAASNEQSDQEEIEASIRYRDMMIRCLQQKMGCLRDQMSIWCEDQKMKMCPPCPAKNRITNRDKKKICCPAVAAKQLQANSIKACHMQEQLENMTAALDKLHLELSYVQKERNELVKYKGKPLNKQTSAEDNDELVHQHKQLLTQYAKKDREVKYLQDKVAQLHSATTGESVDIYQIDILNERIKELKDDEEDYKLQIDEQRQQIDDYRSKFLQAQQTVVEQRTLLDGLDTKKEKIDEQIANEVNRIKCRFQEKLRNLAPLPKLLESEQYKVKTLKQENEDLMSQINNLNTQLRKYRKDLKRVGNDTTGGSGDSKRVNAEINCLKKLQDEMATQNRDLIEQLKIAHEELQNITKEADRHLNRTKERTESTKEALQSRINNLEIELAETRAQAALNLNERDTTVQCMQGQLKDISRHFADAQSQIKTLTKRICPK